MSIFFAHNNEAIKMSGLFSKQDIVNGSDVGTSY